MKLSLKISVAVHILLVTHFFSDTTRINGKILSLSTGCNPVVVRTIVKALKKAGILTVPRGPKSGTHLIKAPGDISLWDIHQAVDPTSVEKITKNFHTSSSKICPVGNRICDVLSIPYLKIAKVIEKEMRQISLEDLFQGLSLEEIERHRANLKQQ
jgi:DNA-binding IscR family transcriptional regulator